MMQQESENHKRARAARARVVRQERLAGDIWSLVLDTELSEEAQPGQFVSLACGDGARLLPRPISICDVTPEGMRLVYRVVGAGTREIAGWKAGDAVRVTGPLGKGYDLDSMAGKRVLAVGGGLGVPPMLFLMKRLSELVGGGRPAALTAVLGYRDAGQIFLRKAFEEVGALVVATDDGSAGHRGTVLDAMREEGMEAEVICACGPLPMLRGLARYAEENRRAGNNITCYVSMEERMACGVGACLGCVVRTTAPDAHSRVRNARVCAEGPVFDSAAIAWEEL